MQHITGSLSASNDLETLERLERFLSEMSPGPPASHDPSNAQQLMAQGGDALVEIDRIHQRWCWLFERGDLFLQLPLEEPDEREYSPVPATTLGLCFISQEHVLDRIFYHRESGRVVLEAEGHDYVFLELSLTQVFVCLALGELAHGLHPTYQETLRNDARWESFLLDEACASSPEWELLWDCAFFMESRARHWVHRSRDVFVSLPGTNCGSTINFRHGVNPELHSQVEEHVIEAGYQRREQEGNDPRERGLRTCLSSSASYPLPANALIYSHGMELEFENVE